jgi:protein-L-isoaspartate(D-aspartate) O-methyltransferase
LRLNNIYVRYADGHLGWASQAPFEGIMVTAAAQSVPAELLEQLDINGLLVMPIETNGQQRLISVRRTEDGFEETDLGAVVFVPLLSGLA